MEIYARLAIKSQISDSKSAGRGPIANLGALDLSVVSLFEVSWLTSFSQIAVDIGLDN